jgi:hypothetical protein
MAILASPSGSWWGSPPTVTITRRSVPVKRAGATISSVTGNPVQ